MAEQRTYAVYFHPLSLDALGEAIEPYLTDSPSGKHVLCTEVDTGGAFCEMTVVRRNPNGTALDCELIIPAGMIRMIVSLNAGERDFGFG